MRLEYSQALQPVFETMAGKFLSSSNISLNFSSGWDSRQTLEQCLKTDLEKDTRYGFTHSGPHRADFICQVDNRLAKDYLSRGQQKLLVLALLLSQVELLNQAAPNTCCILIDDFTAELDTANRLKLLEYLILSGCQVFMTATELNDFGNLDLFKNYKVFHVEHGCIRQL